MKILYVLTKDLDDTEQKIVDEQKKTNEANSFDVRTEKDYDRLVDLVESSDRVISW
jgi:uncharacterized iron-regulated protein